MKLSKQKIEKLILWLLVIVVILTGFNTLKLSSFDNLISVKQIGNTLKTPAGLGSNSDVIPRGIPKIYGQELQLSFDDVSPQDQSKANAAIRKLSLIDQQVNIEGNDMERYINILYKMNDGMSCEYCCGARSIIFADGSPACGCAHSYAMRGLTKYLITQHGKEYSDSEILEEIGKWKTLFFPSQMTLKAEIMKEKGIEFNYINLASNKYRGLEEGSTGSGMVGGC